MNWQSFVRTISRVMLAVCVAITVGLGLMTSPPLLPGLESDPVKHAVGMAVLTFFAPFAFPRASLWLVLLVIAIASLGLEYLQGVPPFQRDPDPNDWLAGMAGVIVAIIAVGLCRTLASLIARNRPGADTY
jgi:hypothetical protein